MTVTLALLFHATAIWTGAWAAEPASGLQRRLAGFFGWYHGLIDQGYAYRYYAPVPPPTPVILASVVYPDGREEEVRLPDRSARPRMLFQRELALANTVFAEFDGNRRALETHRGAIVGTPPSPWAQSYARHLGKTHPGAKSVRFALQMHLIPDPERVRRQIEETGRGPDLDEAEFYSTPERIGEFPCDAS